MKKRKLLLLLLSVLVAIVTLAHSDESPSGLRCVQITKTRAGTHFLYEQLYESYPVVGGRIRFTVNSDQKVISTSGKFLPISNVDARAFTSMKDAEQVAERLFASGAHDGGIFVFPGFKRAYFVRRIEVEPRDMRSGSLLLYVDAVDPHIIRFATRTYANFEGEAEVWEENPITTPKRSIQKLINMDATHTLSGKFVRVFNGNFQEDTKFPLHLSDYSRAKESDRKFDYPDSDSRVTEAMAYYHITRVHDRWQSFGFKALDTKAPVFVNIAASDGGPGYDNAQYSRAQKFPRTGIYVFGGGDELNNSGLDAEILYHEYGHGVLDHIEPGFLEARDSNYPLALHEAFGDISAAALSGNARLFDFADRSRVTGKWSGRNMNNHNRFPSDVIWKFAGISEPHHTGLILDGAWWDLQKIDRCAPCTRVSL